VTEELEVLAIVAGRLESEGIPYMVTGSIAASYYAVPRMTRDIDLVVELSAGNIEWEPERRRIPVDWDDLEMAMTRRMDEVVSFLDLRTGEVRQCRLDRFGREREDHEMSEEEADAGLAEGHLVRVEPLPASMEWDWMAEFAASVTDPRLRDRLEGARRGRGTFRRFRDALAAHPHERERWFAFHDARVREALLEWLAEAGIEPTTPPPERNR
jgi:hypothetical protein